MKQSCVQRIIIIVGIMFSVMLVMPTSFIYADQSNDGDVRKEIIGVWVRSDVNSPFGDWIIDFTDNGEYVSGYFGTDMYDQGTWSVSTDYLYLQDNTGYSETLFIEEVSDDALLLNSSDGSIIPLTSGKEYSFPAIHIVSYDGRSDKVGWVQYDEYSDFFDKESTGIGIIQWNTMEIIPVDVPEEVTELGKRFSGGYSYLNYNDSVNDQFLIVDEAGTISYRSTPGEDNKVICGGDGYFLIEEKKRSIDEAADLYGILAGNGDWVIEPSEDCLYGYENETGWMNEGDQKYEYLGNGWFQAIWDPHTMGRSIPLHTVFDAKKGNFHELYYDDMYETKVLGISDDVLLYEYSDSYQGTVYALESGKEPHSIAETGYDSQYDFSNGIILLRDENQSPTIKYIRADGSEVADYSGYRYAYHMMDESGIIATYVIGKDNQEYLIGIIDGDKISTFEPVKIVPYAHTESYVKNGYVAFEPYGEPDSTLYINVEGDVEEDVPYAESEKGDYEFVGIDVNYGVITSDNDVLLPHLMS